MPHGDVGVWVERACDFIAEPMTEHHVAWFFQYRVPGMRWSRKARYIPTVEDLHWIQARQRNDWAIDWENFVFVDDEPRSAHCEPDNIETPGSDEEDDGVSTECVSQVEDMELID